MRKLFIALALGMFVAPATLAPAWAGKDEAPAEEGEAEAFDLVMEETGSEKLDSAFKKAETPIETVATVRADVAAVNTNLIAALELKDGTPFKDALADLQAKAENKINVSFEENKMPKFSVEEGVPENVQKAVDSLNESFAKLDGAGDKLAKAGEEMVTAATEAGDLVSKPKDLGLKATQIPKATQKANKNIKTLKDGAEVTKELATELGTLMSDVKGAFAG